jgi:hypothetical protein
MAALKNKYGQKTTAERMFENAKDILKPDPGQTYQHSLAIPAEALRAATLAMYGRDAAGAAEARRSSADREMRDMDTQLAQEHDLDRRDDLARYNEQQDFNKNKFDQQMGLQRDRIGWDQEKFGQHMGLSREKMAQQRAYQDQLMNMKRQSIEQKAQAAMQDNALNPFKGDPQAMSNWNKIPSAEDRNAFERAYKERGRDHAFNMLEDQTKPKVGLAGFGRLIPGNKEPSGKYTMSKSPQKNPDAIMSFNEFARQVIAEGGSQPTSVIKAGYEKYLQKKDQRRKLKSRIKEVSSLGAM